MCKSRNHVGAPCSGWWTGRHWKHISIKSELDSGTNIWQDSGVIDYSLQCLDLIFLRLVSLLKKTLLTVEFKKETTSCNHEGSFSFRDFSFPTLNWVEDDKKSQEPVLSAMNVFCNIRRLTFELRYIYNLHIYFLLITHYSNHNLDYICKQNTGKPHPSTSLFILLLSGKWQRGNICCSIRLQSSISPQAVGFLISSLHSTINSSSAVWEGSRGDRWRSVVPGVFTINKWTLELFPLFCEIKCFYASKK